MDIFEACVYWYWYGILPKENPKHRPHRKQRLYERMVTQAYLRMQVSAPMETASQFLALYRNFAAV